MKKQKSIFQYLGGIILFCCFAFILFLVFDNFRPNKLVSLQVNDGYPAPIETQIIPTKTNIEPVVIRTITPVPVTPLPTLTLKPEGKTTLIPIQLPKEDPSGTIFFVAKSSKDVETEIYSVSIDKDGKVIDSIRTLSEIEFIPNPKIYPSPDSKRIAIVGEWGNIVFYNLENQQYEETRLSLGTEGLFFNWFPDNEKILFRSFSLAFGDIYGNQLTTLVVPEYGEITGAVASPDGQYVLYAYSYHEIHLDGLYRIDSTGQNEKLLVKDTNPKFITWSPDGKTIAYLSDHWTFINEDGTNIRVVKDVLIPPACYSYPPSWSPDGKYLAVVSVGEGGSFCSDWDEKNFSNTRISILEAKNVNSKAILSDKSFGYINPVWSPDGSKLAFISNQSGKSEIWVININDSNLMQLTNNDLEERFIVWRKQF
ncbi:MAG: hypothetical protein CL609_02875 [Anaerolineaceae bacterium]|nr:hypothetical protein [Anaerolineaceae bacterium]